MAQDSRGALERLISAFNDHFVIAQRDEVDESELERAEEALRDAFFTYDDVLFTRFGVELPFDILDDDDEGFDDDDEIDDDDDFVDVDD